MKKRIKILCYICLFLLLLFVVMPYYAYATNNQTQYVWSNVSEKIKSIETSVSIGQDLASDNLLGLECGSACLIEQKTGKVLYNYNMHEKLRPASVTKIMSLLLIMEAVDSGKISLTNQVPCTEDAAAMGGSQIWLDVRETLTVDEMLKAICVVSANDCVVAMANYLEGSQEAFVKKMNEKALELGMNDTTFKNCHGIDEDGHLTSSYDIALMSRELLEKHPNITKYTTIWMDSLRDGKSSLVNTNKLVRNYNGCTGLKTGSTSLALYNLSASATRDGLSLIAVIMKAPTTKIRFSNAQNLLDYGFKTYQVTELGKKGDVIQEALVTKGIKSKVSLVLENDGAILSKKTDSNNLTQTVRLNTKIEAPIIEGQKLGEIEYYLNGEIIQTVNLVAKEKIDKISLGLNAKNIYYNWFSLLRNKI